MRSKPYIGRYSSLKAMASHLQAIPVPADLKRAILARPMRYAHNDKTYVMNSLERKKFIENFVKRFRHSGHWDLTS